MKNTRKTTGDGDRVKTTTAPLPLTQFPVICDEAPEMASPLRQFTDAMHEAAKLVNRERWKSDTEELCEMLAHRYSTLFEATLDRCDEELLFNRTRDLALIAAEITRRVK